MFGGLRVNASEYQTDVLRLRAEKLAQLGSCDKARPLLDALLETNPHDALMLSLSGQCAIRLHDYGTAVDRLEQAKSLNPEIEAIDLYLAIARYHQDDFKGARAALDAARERGTKAAELDLYDGLLLLQEKGDAEQAALALERAGRADPTLEAMTSYYAGLAWLSAKKQEQGERALTRVLAISRESIWGQQAQRVLAGLEQRELRSWVVAALGAEYDDNVVLAGEGVRYPGELSDESDFSAIWTLEGGVELFKNENTTFGVLGSYYGSAHVDLEDFNIEYPKLGFWYDRALSEDTSFRLQYDFGYAWVGGNNSFLNSNIVTPSIYHSWDSAGTSRIFAQAIFLNYFMLSPDVPGPGPGGCDYSSGCGPPGLDEHEARNPDGVEYFAGIDHERALGMSGVTVRAGYRLRYLTTEGTEYNFSGHEGVVGVRAELPLSITLDAAGSFFYRSYRHPSTYPNPKDVQAFMTYTLSDRDRRDEEYRFDLSLERPLTDRLDLELAYHYTNDRSNVAVFDYSRNVVGLFLKMRFE